MGVFLDRIVETYKYVNYDLQDGERHPLSLNSGHSTGRNVTQDPRAAELFYINTPWFWISLDICYVFFVRRCGPKFMKDRQPYQLEGIMKIYNIVQVVSNAYVFHQAISVVTNERFNWRCMPLINDGTEFSEQIYGAGKFIFWLKVADLLDTVFFILRKKFTQVSFLHVYHHAMMVFGLWFAMKYAPGGNPIFLVLLNSFVHVVMYGYYLLSLLDPEYKKSIWWKKHLTQLQIIQFFLIAVHTSQILFNNSCGFPYWPAFLLVTNATFMSIMFLDFYMKAYIKKKAK
ncbi:very long chain fatty acid elongase 7 isoform X2 [Anabrus simplex]|uniref:very long chain fatty acid elongase 7 isoform X2 n=1 Tax=Anabrus simplex TaxID=316456 RepID=UPI0035A2851D